MTKYKHAFIDQKTGETYFVDFTPEETELHEKYIKSIQAEKKARQAEAEAKEAARQSALEKLLALGLTEDEIKAIAG